MEVGKHRDTKEKMMATGAGEPDAAQGDRESTREAKFSAPPGARPSPKHGMLTPAQYQDRMLRRLFRTLDYMSIPIFMLAIYGTAIVCEHILVQLIEYLYHSEAESSPLLKSVFE
jgi:hypothetical protein